MKIGIVYSEYRKGVMKTNAPYKGSAKAFADPTMEWVALASLLEPDNIEWINKMSPALFTDTRVNVFYGMQKAYIADTEITFAGLQSALANDVPGELFNARPAKMPPVVRELARYARKRQA